MPSNSNMGGSFWLRQAGTKGLSSGAITVPSVGGRVITMRSAAGGDPQ